MCRPVGLLGCLVFPIVVLPTTAFLMRVEPEYITTRPTGLTGTTTAVPMTTDPMATDATEVATTADPMTAGPMTTETTGFTTHPPTAAPTQPLQPVGCWLGTSRPPRWHRPDCFWWTCRSYCNWLITQRKSFEHNDWVFGANYDLGYSNSRYDAFWDTCKQNCKHALK